MKTKQDILDEISDLAGIQKFYVSSGSTEPRAFFVALAIQLGITDFKQRMTKPELARLICYSLGGIWDFDCESSGSTVTKQGLINILEGLRFLR